MHGYDVTLKMLLRGPAQQTLYALTGVTVTEWLDIELPRIQTLKVDLLGLTSDGSLLHIELQSRNDPQMALRMAEYCLGIYRSYGKIPRQIVLYAGEPPLNMPFELTERGLSFSYEAIDFRTLDGARLLASKHVGDNVIAILAKLKDPNGAVHEIVRRISRLEGSNREIALEQLVVLGGLRRLSQVVKEEVRKMPITESLLDHEIIGPAIKRGIKQGIEKGKNEEALVMLRRLIEKRFGSVPEWAEQPLASRTRTELEELVVRLLDAPDLTALLKE